MSQILISRLALEDKIGGPLETPSDPLLNRSRAQAIRWPQEYSLHNSSLLRKCSGPYLTDLKCFSSVISCHLVDIFLPVRVASAGCQLKRSQRRCRLVSFFLPRFYTYHSFRPRLNNGYLLASLKHLKLMEV